MALRAERPGNVVDRQTAAAAFECLLAALDPDRDRAGERYEILRLRLIDFFTWRGAHGADVLADEALDRVSRRLLGGEVVGGEIGRYALGVARYVLREAWVRQRQAGALQVLDTVADRFRAPAADRGDEEERQSACLERCLTRLPAADSDMLLRYYEHEGRARIKARHAQAAGLGLAPGALRIRMHRLRARLEACVRTCLAHVTDGTAPSHGGEGRDG
jgi:hypothetical protein